MLPLSLQKESVNNSSPRAKATYTIQQRLYDLHPKKGIEIKMRDYFRTPQFHILMYVFDVMYVCVLCAKHNKCQPYFTVTFCMYRFTFFRMFVHRGTYLDFLIDVHEEMDIDD